MSAKEPRLARARSAYQALQKIIQLQPSAEEPSYDETVKIVKDNFYKDQPLLEDVISCFPNVDVNSSGVCLTVRSVWNVEDVSNSQRTCSGSIQVQEGISLGCARRGSAIASISVGPMHKVGVHPALSQDFDQQIKSNCNNLGFVDEILHRVVGEREGRASEWDGRSIYEWLKHDNHISMLVRGWSDILSKIWVEWLEGTCEPCLSLAPLVGRSEVFRSLYGQSSAIDLTRTLEEEVAWWRQIMTVQGNSHYVIVGGKKFFSCWDRPMESLRHVKLITDTRTVKAKDRPNKRTHKVGPLSIAVPALSKYVRRHGLEHQSWIALGIASWLPAMRHSTGLALPEPMHIVDKLFGIGISVKGEAAGIVSRRHLMTLVLESLAWRPSIVQALVFEVGGDCASSAVAAQEALKGWWPQTAQEERRCFKVCRSLSAFPLAPLGYTGGRGWLGALISSWDITSDSTSGLVRAGIWKLATCWSSSAVLPYGWEPSLLKECPSDEKAQYMSKADEVLLRTMITKSCKAEEMYPFPFPPAGSTRVSVLPLEARLQLIRWIRGAAHLRLFLQFIVPPTDSMVSRPGLISEYPVLDIPVEDASTCIVRSKEYCASGGKSVDDISDQIPDDMKQECMHRGGLLLVNNLRDMALTKAQDRKLITWECMMGLLPRSAHSDGMWPPPGRVPPRWRYSYNRKRGNQGSPVEDHEGSLLSRGTLSQSSPGVDSKSFVQKWRERHFVE